MKHIVDTHALLWYLADSPRLSTAADAVLQEPTSEIVLPATAYAEACWIVERGRVPALMVSDVRAAVDADPRITIHPLDQAVIDRSQDLTAINEMHDRQIVATTLVLADAGETVAPSLPTTATSPRRTWSLWSGKPLKRLPTSKNQPSPSTSPGLRECGHRLPLEARAWSGSAGRRRAGA